LIKGILSRIWNSAECIKLCKKWLITGDKPFYDRLSLACLSRTGRTARTVQINLLNGTKSATIVQ
jgi:hypothetical protein